MRVRAVIFDYGEVLSGPPNQHFHRALIETSTLPQDLFDKLYWTYRLDLDAAILNDQTYWQTIAGEAGVRFTAKQIELLNDFDAKMWMDLNDSVLNWALALRKARFKIGILSNMGANVLRSMRRDFAWLDEFDQLTWSCELGVVKPEPAIYRHAVRELAVNPQEALFIDNIEKNVEGARAVGLEAIHFTGVEALAETLSGSAFDLPLPQSIAVS